MPFVAESVIEMPRAAKELGAGVEKLLTPNWLQKRHEEIQQLLVQQHNCGHLPPTLYHPFEKRLRSSYEELLKDGKLQFRTDSGGPEDLYSQLKAKFEEAHTSALGQNSKVVWVNGAFSSQYQSLYNYPKIDLAYNRSELLRELESDLQGGRPGYESPSYQTAINLLTFFWSAIYDAPAVWQQVRDAQSKYTHFKADHWVPYKLEAIQSRMSILTGIIKCLQEGVKPYQQGCPWKVEPAQAQGRRGTTVSSSR